MPEEIPHWLELWRLAQAPPRAAIGWTVVTVRALGLRHELDELRGIVLAKMNAERGPRSQPLPDLDWVPAWKTRNLISALLLRAALGWPKQLEHSREWGELHRFRKPPTVVRVADLPGGGWDADHAKEIAGAWLARKPRKKRVVEPSSAEEIDMTSDVGDLIGLTEYLSTRWYDLPRPFTWGMAQAAIARVRDRAERSR